MGAGLLAKAACQSTEMFDDRAPSSDRRLEQARSHRALVQAKKTGHTGPFEEGSKV
ncbi:hypothetical protein D3C80_1798930 [compost metagenome]